MAIIAVRRTAFRFGIPPEDTRDIGQQVAVALAHQVGEVKCLSAFITRVAHNQCVDWVRKKRPVLLGDRPSPGDRENGSDPIDDVPDPQPIRTELERNEGFAVLWEAIRQADDRCRRIFELRFWGSCSYVDIADREGIPQGQVGMVLSRCLGKLREYMRRKPGAMDALDVLWEA